MLLPNAASVWLGGKIIQFRQGECSGEMSPQEGLEREQGKCGQQPADWPRLWPWFAMSLSEAFKSHSALAVVDLMSSVRSAKSSSAWPHRGPMPLGSQCLQPLGISWPAFLLQTTPPAFPAALTLLEAQVFPFGALDPATRHRPGVFSGAARSCPTSGLNLASHWNPLGDFWKYQVLNPTLSHINQRVWKGPVIFRQENCGHEQVNDFPTLHGWWMAERDWTPGILMLSPVSCAPVLTLLLSLLLFLCPGFPT